MSHRNKQMTRILRLLSLLESAPQGLTVKEMHGRMESRGFEVDERTIRRDVEALRDGGFQLDQKDTDEGTRWILDVTIKVGDHLILPQRELLALFIARSSFEPLRETPFYEDLRRVFSKIEEKIGRRGREFVEALEKELSFHPGPLWGLGLPAATVDTCTAAVGERSVLEVTYKSLNSGSQSERRLGPHFLFFANGALYLLARDLDDERIKTFALSRMENPVMLDESFDEEPLDPESHFASSFGVWYGHEPVQVRLEFSPPASVIVSERRWHQSQALVNKPGDKTELRMEVALSPDLVRWVAGFGNKVKILHPPDLKTMVAEHAREILAGLDEAS